MAQPSQSTRWGVGEAAASLNELAYFERAVAHVLAGWVPRVPDMGIKVALGQHAYHAVDRAARLRARLSGLMRATAEELPVPEGWRQALKRVDEASDAPALLVGLYGVVWPQLIALYRRHLASTDPLRDDPSVRLITGVLPDVMSDVEWGAAMLNDVSTSSPLDSFTKEVEALWHDRSRGADLSFGDALWAPLDRVPTPVRPAGLTRSEPGSLVDLAVDSLHDPQDIARFIHTDLDEEYTTLELIARNSYEHPDMPLQFHVDMARHAAEEARHALMVLELLEDRGFRYGDFDVHTSSYDGLYEFEPCEPGSRKELLWRMLIRQTFMEGLALDSSAHDIERRRAAGQPDIARTLEFVLRDEVFHVMSGMRWSGYLLGDDRRAILQERYEAVTYFTTAAEAQRERLAITHPEKVMEELDILEEAKRRRGGKPPEHPLNRLGRLQAGLNDDDILQVLSWGFATEETAQTAETEEPIG